MLTDLDLHLSLWVEVACTAVYIQNKIPHAILGEKTPEEVFTVNFPLIFKLGLTEYARSLLISDNHT